LYDIDDLQAVIARNRKVRQAEARKAEGIIEEEIQHFAAWLGSLEVLPTLAALRTRANEIAATVVAENRGKWESASPRDLERIDALARAVVNRVLHHPTVRMKALRDDRVHARMALVRDLFDLSVEEGALAEDAPAGGSALLGAEDELLAGELLAGELLGEDALLTGEDALLSGEDALPTGEEERLAEVRPLPQRRR
jgi:glutamyl-tRNA reductase